MVVYIRLKIIYNYRKIYMKWIFQLDFAPPWIQQSMELEGEEPERDLVN